MESLCPSSVQSDHNNSNNIGSLSEISNVYERMLQFLSLIYESVTSGWLDMVESGSIQIVTQITEQHQKVNPVINNGPTLFKELTKSFIQVASPFTLYQKNLAQLERKYLTIQALELGKQLQQIIETVTTATPNNNNKVSASTGWDALQSGAMDELVKQADAIIPICEGAVARFELLNGGYNVTAALPVIDRALSSYATELVKTIEKLMYLTTATSSSSGGSSVVSLDEAQIFCALQVLKIAGMFHRSMKTLHTRTRERMQVLYERMVSYTVLEQQVDVAIEKLYSTGGKVQFQLPDSMSVVEIDSLLTKSIFVESSSSQSISQDNNSNTNSPLSVLQKIANKNDDNDLVGNPSTLLFPIAEESSKRLTLCCYTFVFDVCFAVPRMELSGMSSLSTWKESKSIVESWGGGGGSSYGTLPQSYITHIGEHMLALVQALEPFTTDREALDIANVTMAMNNKNNNTGSDSGSSTDVRSVAYQFWYDFIAAATGSQGTETLIVSLMSGKDLIDFTIGAVPIEEEEIDEGDEYANASTAFCNKWLDAVAFAVTGRLLERIMNIPSLSSKGCEHLNVDLGYIVNVLSALGIAGHPHPLLGHVAEVCILEQDIVTERIHSLDRTNPSADFLRSLEERLSAMRGLK